MVNFFLKMKTRKFRKEYKRIKRFRTYGEIGRIHLLFNIEKLDQVIFFVKALENDGKLVKAYSFDRREIDYSYLPYAFHIWNKKHLNVFNLPLKVHLTEFSDFQADTLIDLTVLPSPLKDYLFFFSKADYRVGFNRDFPGLYDFLLELDQDHDFSFFSDQLLFYLKSIRTS